MYHVCQNLDKVIEDTWHMCTISYCSMRNNFHVTHSVSPCCIGKKSSRIIEKLFGSIDTSTNICLGLANLGNCILQSKLRHQIYSKAQLSWIAFNHSTAQLICQLQF